MHVGHETFVALDLCEKSENKFLAKIANHAVQRCRACHLMVRCVSVKGWEGRWLLGVSGRPHDKVYSEYVAYYH